MFFDSNMKKQLLWVAWMLSFAFSQIETNSYEIRKIRLENFKENYKGKTVRFTDKNSRVVDGVLMEVTDSDFIIIIEGIELFYGL